MNILKTLLLAVGALALMVSLVHAQHCGHGGPCGHGVQMPRQVYTGLYYWMDRFDKQSRMQKEGPSYEHPSRLHLYDPPLAPPGTPYVPPGAQMYRHHGNVTPGPAPQSGSRAEATGRRCTAEPGTPYKCESRTGWCICPE